MVKCPESVGRENQDALEVARGSEKVGDKISAAKVEKDFGIIDENNGSPFLGELEPSYEAFVFPVWSGAQV